jgi:hypothetical protein
MALATAPINSPIGTTHPVLSWRERLVCSRCGSRQVDTVVSGTDQR